MAALEIAEGFPGQRIVVLPRAVTSRAEAHGLLGSLLATDVGYFPKARGHARARLVGIDQAIFIYCVSGRGFCHVAGEELTIGPGEILIVPAGVPHKYGADERRPWTIHWVHAKGRLLPGFLAELGAAERARCLHLGKSSQVIALFEEVLDESALGYTFGHLLQTGQALGHLLSVVVRRSREVTREASDTGPRVSESIDYLKRNLHRPLGIKALAKLAGVSPSHYSVLFKAHTGYAPLDYLTRLRMHQACQLLDSTRHSIKAIAAMVGYEDQLYFSRVFRGVNEVSPKQYRALRKG